MWSTSEKPLVKYSFITEFEDHIFVAVYAEAFFSLHDLITSYVNEKEKVHAGGLRTNSPDPQEKQSTNKCPASNTTSIPSISISEEEKKRKQFDPAEILLSWAGKSIEPYGIDYILQKLGFSYARTTIPKWIQRGFMDPLDKLLAALMLRMVLAGKTK
ncbi:transmembrane protein KIAA1109 homolog [Chelonus insularis]|uniref:transmembrane protein KIAA1109 homolog n=1 Tax=Chelonus insularis TaxID=460826 RepID=UPI00158D0210|nr:transmembrane protein KIAA1109 homolog [Chelonus insularis]